MVATADVRATTVGISSALVIRCSEVRRPTAVTLPYAVEVADGGIRAACERDAALALGVNAAGGWVTYAPMTEAHGLPFATLADVM